MPALRHGIHVALRTKHQHLVQTNGWYVMYTLLYYRYCARYAEQYPTIELALQAAEFKDAYGYASLEAIVRPDGSIMDNIALSEEMLRREHIRTQSQIAYESAHAQEQTNADYFEHDGLKWEIIE